LAADGRAPDGVRARRRADLERLGPPEYRMRLWTGLLRGEYGGGRPRPTRHERGEENVSPVEDQGAVAAPIEIDEDTRRLLEGESSGRRYPTAEAARRGKTINGRLAWWRREVREAADSGDRERYEKARERLAAYVEERERLYRSEVAETEPVTTPPRWRYSVGALGPVEVNSIEAVLTGLEDYLQRDGEPFDRQQIEARLQALVPGESYVDDDDRFAVVRLEAGDTSPARVPLYRSEFSGVVKGHELRDFLTGIEAHMQSWPERRFRVEVRVERVAG